MRERTPTIGENWEEENQLTEHVFIEGDMDHFSGGNWTAIIGNNATNAVGDDFTFIKSGWVGSHTYKTGMFGSG